MNNKLLFCNNSIEIQCFDKESADLASTIPYVHFNRKRNNFRTTIKNIDVVLNLFRGINIHNIDTLPASVRTFYDAEMNRRIATKTLVDLGPTDPAGWLMTHQQLGRELAKINKRYAFFYDTRTGKTPMSLQIIADDVAVHPHHKWLVICPLILIEEAWLPDSKTFFPELKVVNLHGPTRYARLAKFGQEANLYLTNSESFAEWKDKKGRTHGYESWIRQLPIYGCFVDESSDMKSASSNFGKSAVQYSTGLHNWYLLSGTPAPNGEYEYYRQLQSVDLYGIHQSYNQFKNHFFVNVSHNPQYESLVLRPDKEAEMNALLSRYSIYVDKEDVLNTPGREFIPYYIEMPKELKERYKFFKNELYTEYMRGDDKVIVLANSSASKVNKLNQLSSGFIIDTMNKETIGFSDYRILALQKLLDSIGDEQVVIWANFHNEFDVLSKHLGNKCRLVYGKVPLEEKHQNIRAFKEGRVQYLVGNPASMDKGITITNAHFSIYFSLNYSYELWKQSIERIYGDIRIQKHKCLYYVMMAKGTVDEVIYETTQNKGSMSMAVLNHLKPGGLL